MLKTTRIHQHLKKLSRFFQFETASHPIDPAIQSGHELSRKARDEVYNVAALYYRIGSDLRSDTLHNSNNSNDSKRSRIKKSPRRSKREDIVYPNGNRVQSPPLKIRESLDPSSEVDSYFSTTNAPSRNVNTSEIRAREQMYNMATWQMFNRIKAARLRRLQLQHSVVPLPSDTHTTANHETDPLPSDTRGTVNHETDPFTYPSSDTRGNGQYGNEQYFSEKSDMNDTMEESGTDIQFELEC